MALVLSKCVAEQMKTDKFANVRGGEFSVVGDIDDFLRVTHSFKEMGRDEYYGQADRGTRYRRYSDFEYNPTTGDLNLLDHRSYEQSRENNKYVGGVKRDFQDFSVEIIASPTLRSLIDVDFAVYKTVLPNSVHAETWQCQIHQIRIELLPGKEIEITPEGIHCDGYPFSGVHFWGRNNISGAESQVFTKSSEKIAATTYRDVLDTTYLLDRELQHYVTPARTEDNARSAFRQIIAISFSLPGTEYDTVR